MKKIVLKAENERVLKNDADFFGAFERIIVNTSGSTFSQFDWRLRR